MSADKINYTDIWAFARKVRTLETDGEAVAALHSFKEAWVRSYAVDVLRAVDPVWQNARHMADERETIQKPEWMQ